MKKLYVKPEASQILVEENDILTLSVGVGNTIGSVSWNDIAEVEQYFS